MELDPNAQMNVWLSSSEEHQWNPNQKTPATPWEAEIDRLMRLQAASMYDKIRKRCFDQVQEIVADQVPFIYRINKDAMVVISPLRQGVSPVAAWERKPTGILSASNSLRQGPAMEIDDALLSLDLNVDYPNMPQTREVLGLVGESGSGKSTIALAILKLLGWKEGKASASILFRGHDLMKASKREMQQIRGCNKYRVGPAEPPGQLESGFTYRYAIEGSLESARQASDLQRCRRPCAGPRRLAAGLGVSPPLPIANPCATGAAGVDRHRGHAFTRIADCR